MLFTQGNIGGPLDYYFLIALSFLPISIIYAFPAMLKVVGGFTKAGGNTTIISSLFGNGFIGIILGFILIAVGIIFAIAIGLIVSIFIIITRISKAKREV